MSAERLNRLYLTGFMGCGKSTVAPRVARLLGFRSIDLDDGIERRTGKTVSEIFSEDGEAAFRALERAALLETGKMDRVVVSLGGGTLTFGGNREFVGSAGLLVYLRVDFETLFFRMRAKEDRPLLRESPGRAPDEAALRRTMVRLFAGREPYYNMADLVIDAGDRTPEALAEMIAAAVAGNPG